MAKLNPLDAAVYANKAGHRAIVRRMSAGEGTGLVPPGRCLIIGEVAQAHDGSLGTAHAYIDAIADAGADAVKFQTHLAEAESTPEEPWRVQFSKQDASRFDYWKRMEFSEEQWRGLQQHAAERGLIFLSSPFSVEAVELLERVGVQAWKIASGEVTNLPMLERIARTGLPVLLSTGMSGLDEIRRIVTWCRQAGLRLTLFQCTTAYPCPPEQVGLNVLEVLRHELGTPVGLSDHSGTIFPGLAAATLGADAIEVHVTFHRGMFGPDVPASITVEELALLAQGVRFVERMRANPVDKDAMAQELAPMRALFTKSLVARRDLPRGATLATEDLAARKPGTGIPAARIHEIVGRRLTRPVTAGQLLDERDLES
jgi:N,N'-diacetyllegionaminate synthase